MHSDEIRKETVKRPSIDGNGAVFHKEQAIYFTLVDLKELIEKYGVKDIMKQMDSGTFRKIEEFYNDIYNGNYL